MTDTDKRSSVLVVGSGGREHALAWKLGQSSRVADVFVAPGNAGTRVDAVNVDLPSDDVAAMVDFAKKNGVSTVVIGPEAPLAAGLADQLEDAGLRAFGPSAGAAELEGSKVFCKNLLRSADVPTAEYQAFRSRDDALRFLYDRFDDPHAPVSVVVKADGLAAGKGVMVCDDRGAAIEAVQELTQADRFGSAGREAHHRGKADRARSFGPGDHRRPGDHHAAGSPGSQTRRRWRHGAKHRRNGRVLSRSGS